MLDLWIERVVRKESRGQVVYQRYADDLFRFAARPVLSLGSEVVGFEYGPDAERFFKQLPQRLEKFHLSLAADKSGIIRFSPCDLKGSSKFTYLGFDFY